MVRAFLFAAVVVLTQVGCSSSKPNAAGCVQGLNASCMCADGSSGVQVCQADSTFGDCTCAHAAPIGGSNAGNPQSGSPGSGGTTAPAGGAGSTAPATGGTSGGAGAAGRSPGGQAGMMGTGGVPTGGGGPMAGSPYSACSRSSECGMTGTCTMSGQGVGYCSPRCTALINPCPAPMGGSVQASCVGRACMLGSCQQADCPSGMRCDAATFTCGYPPK